MLKLPVCDVLHAVKILLLSVLLDGSYSVMQDVERSRTTNICKDHQLVEKNFERLIDRINGDFRNVVSFGHFIVKIQRGDFLIFPEIEHSDY